MPMSFEQQNARDWSETQESLFGASPPARQQWTTRDDIVRVLRAFAGPNRGHLLLPGGGGYDLKAAQLRNGGLLELELNRPHLVRPTLLIFETIAESKNQSYMWLETHHEEWLKLPSVHDPVPLEMSYRDHTAWRKGTFVLCSKSSLLNKTDYEDHYNGLTPDQFSQSVHDLVEAAARRLAARSRP